jgi:DNA-binding transcriptional MerR regulator/predicted transcriptional regulator YdeE
VREGTFNPMIRIGDFSKLSRVPVKTLRYYDEVGLLKPARVDDWTGYRYYGFDQMARLNRILALKELGFSLERVGHLLDEEVSAEQMRGMLALRRGEIQLRLERESERLAQVEVWLRQIERENKMSKYDVVIKKTEPIKIASVRSVVPLPSDQGPLWQDLEGYLALKRVRPVGACFSLYHDDEFKERDWDIEVCEPITADLPESNDVKVRTLPPVEMMACAVYQGPFSTIGEAYNAIFEWLTNNGYRINGPCREVYLHPAQNGSQTDPNTVTEIQYPVEKSA